MALFLLRQLGSLLIAWPIFLGSLLASLLPAAPAGAAPADDKALLALVSSLRRVPQARKSPLALASFGSALFSDERLSFSGAVACRSCHDPKHAFTRGRGLLPPLREGEFDPPSIAALGKTPWFMHDGRVTNLAAQALEPLFAPLEHGLDPVALCRLVEAYYRDAYVHAFGAFPGCDKPAHGAPLDLGIDAVFLRPITQTLRDATTTANLLGGARSNDEVVARFKGLWPLARATELMAAGMMSGGELQPAAQVSWNAARALAAFVARIDLADAPFDRFADRAAAAGSLELALGDGFGADELRGLQLFTGAARCISCHDGPRFTGDNFFNLGRSLRSYGPPRIGRYLGVRIAKASPFSCSRRLDADRWLGSDDGCKELAYADTALPAFVGAVKTPSLRNVAETAPYLIDGSMATLTEVLEFYNEGGGHADVGDVEALVEVPLRLDASDLQALVAFLRSLSSPAAVDLIP